MWQDSECGISRDTDLCPALQDFCANGSSRCPFEQNNVVGLIDHRSCGRRLTRTINAGKMDIHRDLS